MITVRCALIVLCQVKLCKKSREIRKFRYYNTKLCFKMDGILMRYLEIIKVT